jgi:hypothetical protein
VCTFSALLSFGLARTVVLLSHGKESDHENEIVCSAGGIAVLSLGARGDGSGVLHAVGEVLPGSLLRRKLLRERRELLRGGLLQVRQATGNREQRVAGIGAARFCFLRGARLLIFVRCSL